MNDFLEKIKKRKFIFNSTFFKLLTVLLITLLTTGCSEIIEPEEKTTERNVLLEIYGYSICSNCPYADHAADSLFKEYEGRLNVLEFHYLQEGLPPQFQDTLSPQPETNERSDWYNISSFPSTFIDGTIKIEGADADIINQYRNYIESELSREAWVNIEIENEVIGSSGILTVSLEYTAEDSIPFEETGLFCILTEDSVLFKQSAAEDSIYNHTVRSFIPDGDGMSLSENDTLVELPYSVSDTWNREMLYIVVFLQNMQTYEIYQSEGLNFQQGGK